MPRQHALYSSVANPEQRVMCRDVGTFNVPLDDTHLKTKHTSKGGGTGMGRKRLTNDENFILFKNMRSENHLLSKQFVLSYVTFNYIFFAVHQRLERSVDIRHDCIAKLIQIVDVKIDCSHVSFT